MAVDWSDILIKIILSAIIIPAIVIIWKKIARKYIIKWIVEMAILESPETLELVSKDALEKFHQIIAKQYLKNVRFFGLPWQKKLFAKIASIDYTFCKNNYKYDLTDGEIEFVWKGGVDNWTIKDLSEHGDYDSNTIDIFKHNVKEIKTAIGIGIDTVSIHISGLFLDSSSTACKIEALNDNLLPDNIEMATTLTKIQTYATELFTISTGSSMKYYAQSISHDDEYARELRDRILKITNVYDRLHYIQHEIEELLKNVKSGIGMVSDNISKYECLGDDGHANVEEYTEMRDDLTSIQQKLDIIHGLVAKLLPKDESPVDT